MVESICDIEASCKLVGKEIKKAKHFVVYLGNHAELCKPTLVHKGLSAMVNKSILNFVISERADGLIFKAGVPSH
jgi:hypothetical protein